MIPPLLLDIKPGHKVLDMCASPGSKTAQIIEMLHHCQDDTPIAQGVVIANDVDNQRCYMLVHQANRLHTPCCIITNHDAGNMPSFYQIQNEEKVEMKFDRILCDVPCSGDGTIRKNYDVWLKWNAANGNNFNGIQFRIIKRGIEMLKKDGRLVYSTCSLNPIEDEAVISNLINLSQGSVELVDVSQELNGLKYLPGLDNWVVMTREMKIVNSPDEVEEKYKTQIRPTLFPPKNASNLNLNRCIRILPHHQDTGGFFVAVLKKTNDNLPWEIEKDENIKSSNTRSSSSKKKKNFKCFMENPFVFIDDNDQEWPLIRDYYDIKDSFPFKQLVHRCIKGKKRNLYFLTEDAKKIITQNSDIKFINAGVRLFSRSDDKVNSSGFRLTQEGLLSLYPYLKQDNITYINHEEITKLLKMDSVPMEEFNQETRDKFTKLKSGCNVLVYKQITNEKAEFLLPICAWKGKNTMRAYISKNEKIHFLRICGTNVDNIEPYRKD